MGDYGFLIWTTRDRPRTNQMTTNKRATIFIFTGLLLAIGVLLFSWLSINSLTNNSSNNANLHSTQLDNREKLSDISFMSKDQAYVLQELGDPDEIEQLVRDAQHVFGPIEDLWYKIKMGEKIVTWKYTTSDGWKELYFLNDSTKVVGEFYWFNDLEKNPVF